MLDGDDSLFRVFDRPDGVAVQPAPYPPAQPPPVAGPPVRRRRDLIRGQLRHQRLALAFSGQTGAA
ncbi:hypothetical protein I552_1177 [Mycobacterium xenopi 3993]|nr:hypothetical protein I552_1177 [Mycobacterium xenopi 3993]